MNDPIAMIPYINMAPYRAAGTPEGCDFIPLVPTTSVEALRSGRVLAAAMPVGALPRMADVVKPIGRYGIAAKESSLSVLFFSDLPFAQMQHDDDIRVTADSASSTRLLHLLLEDAPKRHRNKDAATKPQGELIIGDQALVRLMQRELRTSGKVPRFAHVTDLATIWYHRFQVPFVFARWVVRKDAPAGFVLRLQAWLERFAANESDYVRRSLPAAAVAVGLSEQQVARYCGVIRRCFNEEDIAGQALFLDFLQKSNSDPGFSLTEKGQAAA